MFGNSVQVNAQGMATDFTAIPLTAATIGLTFYVQWMVDEGSGLAFSDAATFTPFQF